MSEVSVTLTREYRDHAVTLGGMSITREDGETYECVTLEPTWADNQRNISCIPAGEYKVRPYSSEKYPGTYEVQDVPGRSKILIHAGNYYTDTKGCILVGRDVEDINRDGVIDVTASKPTLRTIKDILGYKAFTLTILDPTS